MTTVSAMSHVASPLARREVRGEPTVRKLEELRHHSRIVLCNPHGLEDGQHLPGASGEFIVPLLSRPDLVFVPHLLSWLGSSG